MRIEELKTYLKDRQTISFKLPSGALVPVHFHVTEVGKVTKDFIDCGGKRRNEVVANFQLWEADDYDHRLHPEKLLKIISLSQDTLGFGDLDIEVEYQGPTIGKYDLEIINGELELVTKSTACLAMDQCGVPVEKLKIDLSSLTSNEQSCAPGGGCC